MSYIICIIGHYEQMKTWKKDLAAALSVSFIAIPQALAYATMAGLPAYVGLYATALPTFFAGLFGTSRVLSTGPVAIISLLTAASLAEFASNPTQLIIASVVLTLLVGLIQIVLGMLRMGSVVNFIAHPVLSGFGTAAAFIIWFSQIPKLLGVPITNHPHFYQVFIQTIQNLSMIDGATMIIGVGSILFFLLLKKLALKLPVALMVIAGGTMLSIYFNYSGPIVGSVPQGFSLFDVRSIIGFNPTSLFTNAFIIAVVGFVSGISIIKQLAVQTRDKVNPNQELIAQGIANMSSGLVGGFPVAGSVSRTAVNMNAGADSKFASVFLGLICLFVMIFFTPFLFHITYASLAAIIMVSVADLIDVKEIQRLLKTQYRDGVVAVVTLVATLFFAPHLDVGILIGIVASLLAHLHRVSKPEVDIFFCHDIDYLHSHNYHLHTYPSNQKVMGVSIGLSLSFVNATYVQEKILEHIETHQSKPKYVLLIANSIGGIDASAEQVLLQLHSDLREKKIKLLLAGLKPHVESSLKNTEFYDFVGGKNIYPEINLALKAIHDREEKLT